MELLELSLGPYAENRITAKELKEKILQHPEMVSIVRLPEAPSLYHGQLSLVVVTSCCSSNDCWFCMTGPTDVLSVLFRI